MPTVKFNLADGSSRDIAGKVGEPIMFLARKHDLPGILAECGGACCCATCHVHISPDWVEKVPEMEDDERDMLDFADGVDEFSRLSCQIKLSDELDGIEVNVPESQF